MKYIMFLDPAGLEYPIVFPDWVDHSMMARCITGLYPGIKPVSAGFCGKQGEAWGKSVTLELESRKEDARGLRKLFGIEE